jgi:hypothetical protein
MIHFQMPERDFWYFHTDKNAQCFRKIFQFFESDKTNTNTIHNGKICAGLHIFLKESISGQSRQN